MVADRKRRLKDGREFDHLFPPAGDKDTTIKKSADVEDTLKLIRKALPQTLWQTEKIAKVLKGRTLEETCSNIWHFVYQHIQYKRDEEGVEQVRSPRRAWSDRKTGVDCDCYTVFILSILRSLNIPCLARITKYPKRYPEVPRWQHVYPIVPKPGHLEDYIDERDWYIVIDCVKDRFDDEQPYLECKDYDMRLDYLDGIGEEETQDEPLEFAEYDNVDLSDLASIYDDEEMGNIFKKIGKGIKKVAKKVGDKVGDGIRFLNRYTNPATILLRNGFLLAMKVNLLNVAGRLRFGYLSDSEAKAKGINLSELNKLRKVKDRAETVYWQAGGKKDNLKKAILKGKGNKDKKVPLSGLDGLDEVYADQEEYNIIHSDDDDIEGLGVVGATAIAAATSAVAAIAGALKQVKGLFNKGGSEEKAFQSETDNAGSAASAPDISESEDEVRDDFSEPAPTAQPGSSLISKVTSAVTAAKPLVSAARSFVPPKAPATITKNETTQNYTNTSQATQPILSNESTSSGAMLVPSESTTPGDVVQTQDTPAKTGFIQKTTTWVKENPGKSLLVAGGIITGGFLLMKAMRSGSGTNGLEGLPKKRKKKRKYVKTKAKSRKSKVKAQNLL
ncbi:MAG TPA: hypothetical protein PLV21_06570 [Cyclobacteriaceae bacterium]|nr:hypothetical protein [Cyclobacteriaceae bacterium]HRJ81526.1 hypothetical protein [Cyclobacteriaceae bacterium]